MVDFQFSSHEIPLKYHAASVPFMLTQQREVTVTVDAQKHWFSLECGKVQQPFQGWLVGTASSSSLQGVARIDFRLPMQPASHLTLEASIELTVFNQTEMHHCSLEELLEDIQLHKRDVRLWLVALQIFRAIPKHSTPDWLPHFLANAELHTLPKTVGGGDEA